jgi:DNA-binding transcriptional regulator YiaG
MTNKDSAQSEPVRVVRLRPRPRALATEDVSAEAAEAEYKACRASLELKFRDAINSWWNEMHHNPPRSAFGELIEPFVIVGLQSAIFTYLDTEMENFAALLLNRGMAGGDGIQAIRVHATELIAGVREYHWRPQLSSVGVSDDTIENDCPHPNLTEAYEEMFWKAETDFGSAVALWAELTNNHHPVFGSTVLEAVGATAEDIPLTAKATRLRGGRPVETAAAIDGKELRELRGDTAQTVFARMCKISVDTLQRAECGDASRQTIRKIERYLKRSTCRTIKFEKPETKEPQETART